MKFSSRTLYALKFMLNLAIVHEQKVLSISEVAGNEDISVKFLEAIVAAIKAKGLVKVRRGPKGGYYLSKAPGLITLLEIVELFEPLQISEPKADSARTNIDLTVRNQLVDFNNAITVYLKDKSLKDMVVLFDAISHNEMYYI